MGTKLKVSICHTFLLSLLKSNISILCCVVMYVLPYSAPLLFATACSGCVGPSYGHQDSWREKTFKNGAEYYGKAVIKFMSLFFLYRLVTFPEVFVFSKLYPLKDKCKMYFDMRTHLLYAQILQVSIRERPQHDACDVLC